MTRYKYDPARVRADFRRKYCRELDLPSGKPSGVEIYPITEDEINELMGDCESSCPKFGEHVTISEWMLWAALRLKYGINYLHPIPKSLQWQTYEPHYTGEKEPTIDDKLEELETKMQNYVDLEIERFNEKFLNYINDGQKSTVKTMACMEEDYKKYFKKNLDIVEF
jgi:hypothetical protein